MGLPRRDHMLGCPVATLSILDMQGCPFLLCNFFQKGLAKNTLREFDVIPDDVLTIRQHGKVAGY